MRTYPTILTPKPDHGTYQVLYYKTKSKADTLRLNLFII